MHAYLTPLYMQLDELAVTFSPSLSTLFVLALLMSSINPLDSPLAALISSFVRAVHGFQSAKYLYIASVTALVYDQMLCLDREVSLLIASSSPSSSVSIR